MKTQLLILSLLLISSLPSLAGDQGSFVLIFNNYNKALKSADIQALEKYLVAGQVSVLKECLADSFCGKSAIKGMKDTALLQYRITNFVEYAKGGRITTLLDKTQPIDKVSGPAAQLYYEGVEASGEAGVGHATFVIENGVWKVSMTTWAAR